jgi:ribosomal protein L29
MLIRNTRRDIAKIHTVLAELKKAGKTAAKPAQPEKEK